MMRRLILPLLIAGCVVFGAIIFIEFEPADGDDTASAEVASRPEASPAIRRQQNLRLDELLAATLARPLFSSTRRPPQSATTGAPTDADLTDTRLAGIVTEPGRRIAIFAVNGAKPLRLSEGEAVSGWRIDSITPREVSLTGPAGTKTLQPKLDPNLVQAAGQPLPGTAGGRLAAPAAVAARPPAPLPGSPAAGRPSPPVPINAAGTPPRPPRPPRPGR
jgi:hypothetical protein